MASAVSITSLSDEQSGAIEFVPGRQCVTTSRDDSRLTKGGKIQPGEFGRLNTPAIPSNIEEKNLRTGFGRFTSGVGFGVGETEGDTADKATVVVRFAGATMKGTQPSAITANVRATDLRSRLFTILDGGLSGLVYRAITLGHNKTKRCRMQAA
jgi:hypothetical protein